MINGLESATAWLIVIVIIVFIILIVLLLQRIAKTVSIARLIDDTQSVHICSAASGYSALSGTAIHLQGQALQSPLLQQDCCWYAFRIEEEIIQWRQRRRQRYWHIIAEGASHHLFGLQDESGQCVICPVFAQIIAPHKKSWTSYRMPSHLRQESSSFFSTLIDRTPRRRLRFFEATLKQDDSLLVLGSLQQIQHNQDILNPDMANAIDMPRFYADHWHKERDAPALHKAMIPDRTQINDVNQTWQAYRKALVKTQGDATLTTCLVASDQIKAKPYFITTLTKDTLARRYYFTAIVYGATALGAVGLGGWLVLSIVEGSFLGIGLR